MENFHIEFDKETPEKVTITGIICGVVYLIAKTLGIIYLFGRVIKLLERILMVEAKEYKEED